MLVDPADRWGRGVAFGTPDETHLLNVASAGMSALPEDPGHFVAWREAHERQGGCNPNAFVPRRQFALYLDDTLAAARTAAAAIVAVSHVRSRAVGVRRARGGSCVVLDVVRRDAHGPADVLLVGSGLTMVDVTLTLTGADGSDRPGRRGHPGHVGRRVHAVSRNARLPRAHVPRPQLAAIPDISSWGSTLAEIRQDATRHLNDVREATGDWRPAVDGLRHRVAALWGRLTEAERVEFLARDAGAWNVLRHRMAPSSKVRLDALQAEGRLTLAAAEVLDAEPLTGGGLTVVLRRHGVPDRRGAPCGLLGLHRRAGVDARRAASR